MRSPSPRLRIYRTLRDKCGLTHHQTRILIQTFLSHCGDFKDVLYREYKTEKEKWKDDSEMIAILSMRTDPGEASRSILRHCWPDMDQDPIHPYACALEAVQIVKNELDYSREDSIKILKGIHRLLRHEERTALVIWEERMIHSYLTIENLI